MMAARSANSVSWPPRPAAACAGQRNAANARRQPSRPRRMQVMDPTGEAQHAVRVLESPDHIDQLASSLPLLDRQRTAPSNQALAAATRCRCSSRPVLSNSASARAPRCCSCGLPNLADAPWSPKPPASRTGPTGSVPSSSIATVSSPCSSHALPTSWYSRFRDRTGGGRQLAALTARRATGRPPQTCRPGNGYAGRKRQPPRSFRRD